MLRSSKQQILSSSPQARPLFFFPVSLPASTPRAFHFRQQTRPLQTRPLQKTQKTQKKADTQKRKTIASWSDLGVSTEYPVCPGSEPGDEDDEDRDERRATETEDDPDSLPDHADDAPQQAIPKDTQTTLVHQSSSGYHRQALGLHHQNATTAMPSPWLLADPQDAMGGLPITVTKQSAMLIHTCTSYC